MVRHVVFFKSLELKLPNDCEMIHSGLDSMAVSLFMNSELGDGHAVYSGPDALH